MCIYIEWPYIFFLLLFYVFVNCEYGMYLNKVYIQYAYPADRESAPTC